MNGLSALTRSLQTRALVLVMTPLVAALVLTLFMLNLVIQRAFQEEIGERLTSLARVLALKLSDERILWIHPGAESSAVYRKFKTELSEFRQLNSVHRIRVFRTNNQSVLDTDEVSVGTEYLENKLDEFELSRVVRGEAVASTYFEGADRRPVRIGYAPIWVGGTIEAVVAVEASSRAFGKLNEVSRSVFWVGILMLGIVFLGGILFTRSILTPISGLTETIREIGRGNYTRSLPSAVYSELEALVGSVSLMRDKIVNREREMTMMLAGVAHELRNPLGGIQLHVDILEGQIGPRSALSRIRTEVQTIGRVVSEFVHYAQSTQSRPLSRESVSLRSLISEILDYHKVEIQKREIQIEIALEVEEAYLDPGIVRSVISNIIVNAIQSMGSRGRLTIVSRIERGELMIAIGDTGTGIVKENLSQIFEPFFTTKEKGSGLGLSLSARLMRRHGGAINLDSEVGKGTTVTLTFPRLESVGERRSMGSNL